MELAEYVQWARGAQPFSRLGFFSQPVKATSGPLAGKMLKVYPGLGQQDQAQRLQQLHHGYKVALAHTGRNIPETQMEIVKVGRQWVPLIIQEAFELTELVRQRMEAIDEFSEYTRVLECVLADTLDYLRHRAAHPQPALGFHPTLRNYALRGDELYYFDTFPPMNLPQPELNQLIRQSLPQGWLRVLARIIPPILNRVSHEYYNPVAMVSGIVGSACRLRPEWSQESLAWCQGYLSEQGHSELPMEEILEKISAKPKLSKGWVVIRKLTNNVGKPNVS